LYNCTLFICAFMCHWAAPLVYLYILYLNYLQFLVMHVTTQCINYLNQLFPEMAVTVLLTLWYNRDWHSVTRWIFLFHSSAINTQNHSFTITGSRNQMVVVILFWPPQGARCDKTKTWHTLSLSHPRVHSLLRVRHPVSIHVGEQKDHHSQLYWTAFYV